MMRSPTAFSLKIRMLRNTHRLRGNNVPASVSLELTWSEARPRWRWSFPYWSGQCALIITERVWSTISTREWWSSSVTSHWNTTCTALTYLQPHRNIQLQSVIKLFLWWVIMQSFFEYHHYIFEINITAQKVLKNLKE